MQDRDSVYEDPFWEAYQYDNEELSITKSIVARGQFGASYALGRIQTNRSLPIKINTMTMTMMKSCMENEEGKCYNGLKAEMNILYDLCHKNVILLVGYCLVKKRDICKLVLVFDYCSNGNLLKVLQKGRPYFNMGTYCPKKAVSNEALPQTPEVCLDFSGLHLLRWAIEIVRGMEYLAFKGVIHGDIASRNILLTCDWTAKIYNFGIAQRYNRQESYANSLPMDVLPIAWMAPETIEKFTYSESSDIWGFAITLWEIYTLGEMPYRDKNVVIDAKFFDLLSQVLRPARPSHADENMWKLMKSCWSYEPESRPTFSKIKTILDRTCLRGSDRDRDATASCSTTNSVAGSENKNENTKKVSFGSPPKEGFIRKCSVIAEEVFSRARIKSNS